MKRFSAGLVLMLLCTFSIFAQNKVITVSGRVVESDTKEPAAQATVQYKYPPTIPATIPSNVHPYLFINSFFILFFIT